MKKTYLAKRDIRALSFSGIAGRGTPPTGQLGLSPTFGQNARLELIIQRKMMITPKKGQLLQKAYKRE